MTVVRCIEFINLFSNRLFKKSPIGIAILLFLPQFLFSQKLNLPRHFPVVQAESQVWIGTPSGLLQFNPDDDSFKRYTLPGKNQNPAIKEIYYHNEWLWCLLDSGLAALHVRLNEWLFFDTKNGLPSNTIRGLAFQEDYVWIATDKGAARFDLLIEEWEIYDERRGIPEQSINDIIAAENKIWFIASRQFSEFDPQFEKWRNYRIDQDTTTTFRRGFMWTDDLWLVSDRGLVRFNPQLQTQQLFFQPQLRSENLLDLIIENNFLWAITRLGLFYYDSSTKVWREFEGNSYLKAVAIVAGYIAQTEIWILADQNVLVWDRTTKKWELLDYASGLSTSNFKSVAVMGGMVFLMNPLQLDYRTSRQTAWRKYAIQTAMGISGSRGKKIFQNLFDNESGGTILLGKNQWNWAGTRMTFLHDFQQQLDHRWQAGDPITQSGERLDIKSQILLAESRNVSGFYNNIDYSETMYGVRYRSRESDILHEFNWGDYRREPGSMPFGETASLFGSNVWLQAGAKTPRFKRSLVSLKAQTGEQRSQKTYEIYQGATDQSRVSFRDIDYLKNQFFAIPDLDSLHQPDAIRIYVDDLNPATNTKNTLDRQTIAGITGDFDLWKATEDYYFYEKANRVRFLKYINLNWTIVVRYSIEENLSEAILQHGSTISTAQKNFYYLKGTGIIPYSFTLTISDNAGAIQRLADFQLDQDGDGTIDASWIDYENGILFFPQAEPFPPEIYDSLQPRSIYEFEANFQTELSIIQLAHRNLIRGSEVIRLDGVVAAGGNDYVLDYTNGTLVFVREGIISHDTRIEIEYEYYLTDENQPLHSAAVNWSPSDNFYLQGDWLQFSDSDNQNVRSEKRTDLFTIHGEIRQNIGEYDFRIIPGFAFHPTENILAASDFQGLVSTSKFRFQSVYQNFQQDYQNIYRPQSVIGDVKSNLQFASTVDVRNDLRLSGEWKNVSGYSQNSSTTPTDQSTNLTLLFHRQHLPAWQVSYQKFKLHSDKEVSNKFFFQSRLEYQLPEFLSRKILIQGLKMEAFLRTGQQDGSPIKGSEKNQFFQGYFRLNTMISDRFQGSFFYRRNDLNSMISGERKNPISRAERLIFDLVHEEWRLIQLNLRFENKVDQSFYVKAPSNNINVNQYSQANFRFSPGQVWQIFSPFHFELNLSQSVYGWGVINGDANSWLWNFSSKQDKLNQCQISRNFFLKNEFRPSSQWLIYSAIERNAQETKFSASNLQNHFWRWTEKMAVKLSFKTRLNIQYRQYYQNLGYDRMDRYVEPSSWIEHRWTPDFQNTFYLLYRYRHNEVGQIQNDSHNFETRYDLIWRAYQFLEIRRWEIRQSFSGNHRRTNGDLPERIYQLTSSSSIDLYLLHSMIVRARIDLGQVNNELLPDSDYFDVAINVKLSLRF